MIYKPIFKSILKTDKKISLEEISKNPKQQGITNILLKYLNKN